MITINKILFNNGKIELWINDNTVVYFSDKEEMSKAADREKDKEFGMALNDILNRDPDLLSPESVVDWQYSIQLNRSVL